jgi:hypothetical protein
VDHEDLAEVVFCARKTHALETLRVNRVINCTGSETDCRRIEDSLISSLFLQGLARPDPLFMGVDGGKTARCWMLMADHPTRCSRLVRRARAVCGKPRPFQRFALGQRSSLSIFCTSG